MIVSTDIDAPADRVWSIITDLDSAPERLRAVEAVERLDGGGPVSVGTRWIETRRMFGRSSSEEMEVVSMDSPHAYTVGASGGGAVYRTELAVGALGRSRSRLTMSFDAAPTGRISAIANRLLTPLVSRSMRKALEQDLADIRQAAEAS